MGSHAQPASVRADSEVTLVAKVTGHLKTITRDRGDRVQAGELIAVLEIPEMTAEIAHAKRDMAEATLRKLETLKG